MELYHKYRPTKLSQVVGQPDAIRILKGFGSKKLPHFLLFTGPSGCGKTTIARILKGLLKCHDRDFYELNCADIRGIDMIRDIRSRMNQAPMGGRCRIWLIDEAHRLTGDAQNALLKMLEDTPSHVYFFMATTDPQKLLKTIKTRATEIKVKLLKDKEMAELLLDIIGKEVSGITDENGDDLSEISDDVVDRIVDVAEGSPRKALVILNQIIGIPSENEQLDAIASSDTKAQAIELARALLNPRSTWPSVAKILKDLDDDPEQLRYMVLGYCSSVLLSGGAMAGRAFAIIEVFADNFYDSKKAGLVAACYEVVGSK